MIVPTNSDNMTQPCKVWLDDISDCSEGSSVAGDVEQVVFCNPVSPIVSTSPSLRESANRLEHVENEDKPAIRIQSCLELLPKTNDKIISPCSLSVPVSYVRAGTPIESVLAEFIQKGEESAFYVVDLGSVMMRYFEFVRQLPRVKPHYAVKCNPDEPIIRMLAGLGCNFDCASKAEISMIHSCGISSERIIYANPCKPESHLKYAVDHGVDLVTFDNKDELKKISRICPNIRTVLRIATEDHDSLCPLSTKFGALPDEVMELLCMAKYLDVRVEGVAFHVGSGCRSVETYIRALYQSREIFDCAVSLGMEPFHLLDIGGGFPGFDGESPVTFLNICCGIRDTMDTLFPVDEVKVIAEPGRYFVSSAFTLATRVVARRFRTCLPVVDGNCLKAEFCQQEISNCSDLVADYYVDDGVYGSFRDVISLGVAFYPKTFSSTTEYSRFVRSCVFGPTCDSIDCIIRNYPLPILQVGEWLYFIHMGAYTVSLASSFNGFSCPNIRYICSSSSEEEVVK